MPEVSLRGFRWSIGLHNCTALVCICFLHHINNTLYLFRMNSRYVLEDDEEKSRLDLILFFGKSFQFNSNHQLHFGNRSSFGLLSVWDLHPSSFYCDHVLVQLLAKSVTSVVSAFQSIYNYFSSSATPARITLGVTTVLTITTLKANADSNLPHTSYPKVKNQSSLRHVFIFAVNAIGLYLWVCFVFTFAALIEFSAAAYLEKRKNFLQSKIQTPHQMEICVAEIDSTLNEKTNTILLPTEKMDRSESLDIVEDRARRNSFISKRMNDPKLIGVNLLISKSFLLTKNLI